MHLTGRVFFEQKQKIDSSWVFLLTTLSSPFWLTLLWVLLLVNQSERYVHFLFKSTATVAQLIQDLKNLMHSIPNYSPQFLEMVCGMLTIFKMSCYDAYRSKSFYPCALLSLSRSLPLSLCGRLKLFWMNFQSLPTQTYNAERNDGRKYVCVRRLTFIAYFVHGYAQGSLEQW